MDIGRREGLKWDSLVLGFFFNNVAMMKIPGADQFNLQFNLFFLNIFCTFGFPLNTQKIQVDVSTLSRTQLIEN